MVIGIPEFDRWSMNVEMTGRKEITLQFISDRLIVSNCPEMMENGKINVSNMVTHRFPFDKTKEAFDLVAEYGDGVMKAMIDFELLIRYNKFIIP